MVLCIECIYYAISRKWRPRECTKGINDRGPIEDKECPHFKIDRNNLNKSFCGTVYKYTKGKSSYCATYSDWKKACRYCPFKEPIKPPETVYESLFGNR